MYGLGWNLVGYSDPKSYHVHVLTCRACLDYLLPSYTGWTTEAPVTCNPPVTCDMHAGYQTVVLPKLGAKQKKDTEGGAGRPLDDKSNHADSKVIRVK